MMTSASTSADAHRQLRLPAPTSVAVIGASHLEGGSYFGARTMSNMVAANPTATIYPVNPRYAGDLILGHRVHASLTELPTVPDLVVICTGVPTVCGLLEEAGKLGVAVCVVLASHTGTEVERREFDSEIRAISGQFDMTVIGPNSLGVFHGQTAVTGSFSTAGHGGAIPAGNLSVISQSGAVLSYILQALRGTSVGFSWLVSTGNEAAATLEQLLDSLSSETDTQMILLFIEGIADGRRFREAALRARLQDRPIVMMTVGSSESGQRAVRSHTGRIAGAKDAIAAIATESGIVTVSSYQPMFDAVAAITQQTMPLLTEPHGRRAAIITASGGLAVSMADHLSEAGWVLPAIAPEVMVKIAQILDQQDLVNPVDVVGAFGNPGRMAQVMLELGKDASFDAIFFCIGAGGLIAEEVAAHWTNARSEVPQEVYACWVGMTESVGQILMDGRISAFPDPARAALAAEASATLRSFDADQRASAYDLLRLSAETRTIGSPDAVARTYTAAATMNELRKGGVSCVDGRLLESIDADASVQAAEELGYPVVLKIESSELSHKSDAGGVKIRLSDADAVRHAAQDLQDVATTHHISDATLLVQPMLAGIEVLVGVKEDSSFGPMLVVGLGGVLAELFADVVTVVLPTDRPTIERALARHARLNTLLSGFRGEPPADKAALLDLLEGVATWATSRPGGVVEMDLNPVIVNVDGAFAVDARMVAP